MSCPSRTVQVKRKNEESTMVMQSQEPREYEIVYRNLITFGYCHIAAIYGIYLCYTEAKWATIVYGYIIYILAEIGVTAGAHRLWSHKTYKAKLPLEILLMVMNSIAFQNTATDWVRDHRLHHKYSDTDADPHNASRGFFFSHIGWLLTRKHPDVKKCGKNIDMSDILNNPVLKFQKKYAIPVIGVACFAMPTIVPVYCWGETRSHPFRYAIPVIGVACFAMPTIVPVYCWGETWRSAWYINLLRYTLNLNMTFLVNSAAHIWGNKAYDKNILSSQNISVSILTFGEGFHNYHHVFPWDYRTAELGNNCLNVTTKFIDFFAKIGWAYDLKTVPEVMIKRRSKRTGDGSDLWGWNENRISEENK